YYDAVRLPAAVHLGLIAHRLLPTVRVLPATDGHGASRFSRAQRAPGFYAGVGSSTPQGRRCCRTPPCCLPYCVTPSAPWIRHFGAHNFGIPSLHMPLSKGRARTERPRGRPWPVGHGPLGEGDEL